MFKGNLRERTAAHQFEAGSAYIIDLTSQPLDTYLFLKDPSGKVLVSADDSGEGLSARIAFTAPRAGVCEIVVARFGAIRRGVYDLTVRVAAAEKK